MRTIILPKPKHSIFNDAAKVMAALPGDDVLCFGVHDWTMDDIAAARQQTSGKLIAAQTELLCSNGGPYRHHTYIEKLKHFDEVWDYSEHNIPFLKENGINNTRYVPVVPDETLREEPLEKDIDLFHYGAFTRHRIDLINRIIREGFDLTDALLTYKKALHDEELHNVIRRSKVIIGVHSHPQCPIQEAYRYQYPLSNGITVLGEKSLTNPLNIEEFAGEEEMVEKLRRLIAPKFDHGHIRGEMLQLCTYYSDYAEEARQNMDSPDPKAIVLYALDAMGKDRLTIRSIAQYPERADEIARCEWKIFHSLLLLWQLIRDNKKQFSHRDYAEARRKIGERYAEAPRELLKSQYKSQKGRIMPRLRCLLLLNGWRICKTSMDILSAIGYDKKLVGDLPLETNQVF